MVAKLKALEVSKPLIITEDASESLYLAAHQPAVWKSATCRALIQSA
ncbi:MAG: hypothetical protein R3F22_06410 [Lysobacteraceae bacterium]